MPMRSCLLAFFLLVAGEPHLHAVSDTPPGALSSPNKALPTAPISPDTIPLNPSPALDNAAQALPTDSYENAFMKMLLTLVLLVVLVFFTVWMLRRLSQGRFRMLGRGETIKIIDRKPLSPKTMLYIVEIKGKELLIAESQLELRRLMAFEEVPQDE